MYIEVQTLAFLKAADDPEEIARLRIAVRTEHAHQALGRFRGQPAGFLKPNGDVAIVVQDRTADIDLVGKKTLHAFFEQHLREPRVACEPLPDCHPEIARQINADTAPQR